MKKKLKLHTLPTDNATQLLSCYHRYPDAQYWLFDEHMGKNFVLDNIVFHHLYLTSDEGIKKGDKFIALSVNEVRTALAINGTQITDEMKSSINKAHARKIVATDNPKLLWKKEVYNMPGLRENGIDWRTKIHNIPTSLIEYFVEKQGKVDEVMVEYEMAGTEYEPIYYEPKLNSSGEIIWSPIEDEFEEVRKCLGKEILNILIKYKERRGLYNLYSDEDDRRWLNENFPEYGDLNNT